MTQDQLSPAFRVVAAVLRPLLMLLTRRDWRGAEHLPKGGGVVVVSNHLTHLDPLTFAHFLYDNGRLVRFLAKAGVFRVPVVGRIIDACGQIPVSRESGDAVDAYRAAVAAVERGECVAIYPEGTITRDPDQWPMRGKTGAARVALQTGCAIIPIGQWGAQEILPAYSRRPHLFPRKTVHVHAGPPVDLEDLRRQPLTAEVLNEATTRAMRDVTSLLQGIRGGTPPEVAFDPRVAGLPATGNYRRGRLPRTGSA